MKISTRIRYGMRAMVELAKQPQGQTLSLREITANQGIPAKYLEQMLAMLKIGGLIESVRGAGGGYRLTRSADQMTAWDVYAVLDSCEHLVDCQAIDCDRTSYCATRELWCEMSQELLRVLKSHTLKELADHESSVRTGRSPLPGVAEPSPSTSEGAPSAESHTENPY